MPNISVQPRQGEKARTTVLPFAGGLVTAGSTASFIARSQILFRPDVLVIPSGIAPTFDVTDVRIGKNSQFASTGIVPALLFSERATGVDIQFDTIQPQQDVTITVVNNGTVDTVFRGAFAGRSVE